MNINIVCVGKLKEQYWRAACEEYGKRLSRFCRLQIIEIKEERLPDNATAAQEQAVIVAEGQAILHALAREDHVIALAIAGRSFDSPALAEYMQQLADAGCGHISFVIGGSLGLSAAVLQRADLQLSFSALTFPHQLMRVILLEQLYRAEKINAHEKYHK